MKEDKKIPENLPRPREIVKNFFSKDKFQEVLIPQGNKPSSLEEFVHWLGEGKDKERFSFTRVRKYYEYFLSLYEDARNEGKKLSNETFIKLYMLRSYIVYDQARETKGNKKNLLWQKFEKFREFIDEIIAQIEDFEHLERAKLLFEAFVGYARAHFKNR